MKKRRDITLGEMQDECRKRMHICDPDVDGNNECKYFEVCKQMRSGVFVKPCPEVWDLTDPPRFNEAQMALLRWWYDRGAKTAVLDHRYGEKFGVLLIFRGPDSEIIGDMTEKSIFAVFEKEFPNEQRADLAELLGKDAT